MVSKCFGISNRPSRVQVNLLHIRFGHLKCNTDRVVRDYPGHITCSGVFNDGVRDFISGFFTYIDINVVFQAEVLQVMMMAIEQASQRGWNRYG